MNVIVKITFLIQDDLVVGWEGSNMDYDYIVVGAGSSEAGREPDQLPITSFGLQPEEDQIKKTVDAGIDRIIFALPPELPKVVIPILDNLANIATKYRN